MTRFEALDPEIKGVLGKKVNELGLRVEGSPVEGYVAGTGAEASAPRAWLAIPGS